MNFDVYPPKPLLRAADTRLAVLGQQVKRAMLAGLYPWFVDQNVVSVEGMDPDGTANTNRENAFDDIKMLLDGSGTIIGGPWEATTQPGRFWTQNRMNPSGAFIIALGSQSCWTPGEYHGYEVWRQAEGSHIIGFRDDAEDYTRHGSAQTYGNIGVHHHGGNSLPKGNIGQSAAGCQVIRAAVNQATFMDITLKCPRYLANPTGFRLTATVLPAAWVLGETKDKAMTNFRSLIPGGYYSDTPNDHNIPVSIRCNNPGAINGSSWEKEYPGYVSEVVTTPGNATTIFEAPEYGVAAWWELMRRYRTKGVTTVGDIINTYGGGQNYSSYVAFVMQQTGLAASATITLTGDDARLLSFAKAMYWNEAGRQTPLSDAQILYGFQCGRNGGQEPTAKETTVSTTTTPTTGTVPVVPQASSPIAWVQLLGWAASFVTVLTGGQVDLSAPKIAAIVLTIQTIQSIITYILHLTTAAVTPTALRRYRG